jgi:type IV fimbrial biogenesis protein FimT
MLEIAVAHGLRSLRCKDSAGFTLIEMMTVVAVAAILLGIGVPGLRSLLHSQQIRAVSNDLFASLALTRSEAIQRGTRVDLVPADGRDWSSGWVVFIDEDGNQKPDDGERIIFLQGPVARGVSIEAKLTGSDDYIAYQGSGRTRTNASSHAPMAGSLVFKVGTQERRIVINMLGRARVCNPHARPSTC